MPVDIFGRPEFEAALTATGREWRHKGVVKGEHVYLVAANHGLLIEVRSSIHGDTSADCGDDSIRSWLVTTDGKPVGGKMQRWVTRVPGWDRRLVAMLKKQVEMSNNFSPCPVCGKTPVVSVKKDKGKAFIFCPDDKQALEDKNYRRHRPLAIFDLKEETVEQAKEIRRCPTCNEPLRIVNIGRGSNAGKQAYTCPKKNPDGSYANHIFEVIEN